MSERAPSLIAVAGRRAPSTRRSRRPAAVTAHVNRSLRATTSAPTSSRPRPTGPPVVRATRCPSCARVRGTTRLGPAPPRATASAAGSPPAEPRISRPPRRPVVDRGGDKFMRAQFHGGTNGTLGLGLTLAMSFHRAACSTEGPCSSDADWCIRVDGVCVRPSRPHTK